MAVRPAIALATYLTLQKTRGRARAERRLSRETAAGRESAERGSERLGATQIPRPDGPLVWIHVGSEAEAMGIPELIDRLRDLRDDLGVLITAARHGPDDCLPRVCHAMWLCNMPPMLRARAPARSSPIGGPMSPCGPRIP